ncbi:MAG: acyltransferase [Micavibrio aeruginosavorus]|nr:acyltransferase [Micavibrio aeruginosavorus]
MAFSPPETRLHSLDTLRILAIILVFFSHYTAITLHSPVGFLNRFAPMGVDLSFVLSGYLIADHIFRSVAAQTFDLKQFYLRRSLRILPAYFAVLFLYFCFPFLQEKPVTAPLWKFLTLTMNYGLENGGFSHIWSLCLEEHFYLLFPLIALFLLRKATPQFLMNTLIFLVLGAISLRFFLFINFVEPQQEIFSRFKTYNKYIYYPSITRLDGVVFGALIALAKNHHTAFWGKLTGIRHSDVTLLSGIAVLVLCSILERNQNLDMLEAGFSYTLHSLGCALLLLSALSPNCLLYKIRIPGAQTLAILSFSIYLVHKMTIYGSMRLLSGIPLFDESGAPFLLAAIAMTLLASWLLYRSIERPFLTLRDRLTQSRPLTPPASGEITPSSKPAASP